VQKTLRGCPTSVFLNASFSFTEVPAAALLSGLSAGFYHFCLCYNSGIIPDNPYEMYLNRFMEN